MQCFVYKSALKAEHYLFLPAPYEDAIANQSIPAGLIHLLGDVSLVIQFELSKETALAQADAVQVTGDIEEKGYFLQMPSNDPSKDIDALEQAFFSQN